MPRPATMTESTPPTRDAGPEVARAIDGYLAIREANADAAYLTEGHLEAERAWIELEGFFRGLPRGWHIYRGARWGIVKRSKQGLALVREDLNLEGERT